ncbi:FecR domain-containing protein [Porticoccaceae bacterium LTM1]|nr:FecR domain-containing protein [Porticoccaceae bacterium LTM1]
MNIEFAERKAAADAALLLHGTPSDEEMARIESAKNQSKEYATYLNEFLVVSDSLEGLQDDKILLSQLNVVTRKKSSSHIKKVSWMVIAASLLVTVATSFLWTNEPVSQAEMSRYVSRVGEQKLIELEDGSSVMMNTGTEIIVEMTDQHRAVILNRGEAYFSIAGDPERPFNVSVGDRSVTVLGTEFNVKKQNNGFILAVNEGLVAVHAEYEPVNAQSEQISLDVDDGARMLDLQQRRFGAGMVAEFNVDERMTTVYKPESIKKFVGWKSGVIRFEGVPMSEVVMELNRYSGKKILIKDQSVFNIIIFASVNVNNISEAINMLDVAYPIDVIHQFDQIVLVSQKDK